MGGLRNGWAQSPEPQSTEAFLAGTTPHRAITISLQATTHTTHTQHTPYDDDVLYYYYHTRGPYRSRSAAHAVAWHRTSINYEIYHEPQQCLCLGLSRTDDSSFFGYGDIFAGRDHLPPSEKGREGEEGGGGGGRGRMEIPEGGCGCLCVWGVVPPPTSFFGDNNNNHNLLSH